MLTSLSARTYDESLNRHMLNLAMARIIYYRRQVLRHARSHVYAFNIIPGEQYIAHNQRVFTIATTNSTYLHIANLQNGVRILRLLASTLFDLSTIEYPRCVFEPCDCNHHAGGILLFAMVRSPTTRWGLR